jgi:hypothetical protein
MCHVTCPDCGMSVGLGTASEPGRCPRCDVPLMLTAEMRALTPDQIAAECARQSAALRERTRLPLLRDASAGAGASARSTA